MCVSLLLIVISVFAQNVMHSRDWFIKSNLYIVQQV